ncbi:MAG TPA: hypothetical protein DIS66_08395 [Candidatus Omnitrophica bacterium]|nr:hypothetical protein [Candidatus Omnitrophota bacterium]
MKPFVSVVIPAYNEEQRISETLCKIVNYALTKPFALEIIVSDDGSLDGTVEAVKSILNSSILPHQVLRASMNQGKGAAVRRGMLAAAGEYRLFSDADLSTPIEELDRFLPLLIEKKADIVIGSRAMQGANIVEHQPWFRECMGRIFNKVATIFAFHGIKDSQCGFKCFTAEATQKLFAIQKLDGFSFDVELIFLAQKNGFRIAELPVTWINSAATKVKVLSDPIKMFWDVLRIRAIHRKSN